MCKVNRESVPKSTGPLKPEGGRVQLYVGIWLRQLSFVVVVVRSIQNLFSIDLSWCARVYKRELDQNPHLVYLGLCRHRTSKPPQLRTDTRLLPRCTSHVAADEQLARSLILYLEPPLGTATPGTNWRVSQI